MTTVSQSISGVRQLCTFGLPPTEPTEEQLSTSHILTTLNDIETALTNEATLGQQNQYLQQVSLGCPGARDISFIQPNFGSLVMMEYQVDATYDSWRSIKIINKVELNEAEEQGIYACAIYGTPPRITFNFVPAVSLAVFQLRAWYETSPMDQLPADTPRLNPSFLPLWKYEAAIICREVYLGLPEKKALSDTRDRLRVQYYRDVNKSPDQKAQLKPASYGTELLDALYEPWRY